MPTHFQTPKDIPEEIINEINEHYNIVDWTYYGMSHTELKDANDTALEQMRCKRLEYLIEHDDYSTKEILDPETFETYEVNTNSHERFMVRAMYDDEESTIYPWYVFSVGLIPNTGNRIKSGKDQDDEEFIKLFKVTKNRPYK